MINRVGPTKCILDGTSAKYLIEGLCQTKIHSIHSIRSIHSIHT